MGSRIRDGGPLGVAAVGFVRLWTTEEVLGCGLERCLPKKSSACLRMCEKSCSVIISNLRSDNSVPARAAYRRLDAPQHTVPVSHSALAIVDFFQLWIYASITQSSGRS